MVSGLLVIDAVILLSWQLRDPLRRRVELFPLEDPPNALDDVKIRPELEHCESEHNTIWLGIIKYKLNMAYNKYQYHNHNIKNFRCYVRI